jgi:hypothetical protein
MYPANKMVVTSHSAGNNTNILTNLQVGNNNYKVLSGSTIGMICDQTFPATRTEIEHGGDQASGEVVTSQQGGNNNNNVMTAMKELTKRTKLPIYNLVGLIGWWRRQEADCVREMKKKEENKRKLKLEKEKRSDFVSKFFPTMGNTPGGTERLENPTYSRESPILKQRINLSILNTSGSKRKSFMGGGEENNSDFIKKRKVSTKLKFGKFLMSDTGTSDLAGPSEEIACIFGESKSETRSDG